jgi:hypothetical protein
MNQQCAYCSTFIRINLYYMGYVALNGFMLEIDSAVADGFLVKQNLP